MKILYYLAAFVLGYCLAKCKQAHKHPDEPDEHAEELIRQEQDAETYGEL